MKDIRHTPNDHRRQGRYLSECNGWNLYSSYRKTARTSDKHFLVSRLQRLKRFFSTHTTLLRKQYCSAALLCSNISTYICDSAGMEPRTSTKRVTVCRRLKPLSQGMLYKLATVADTFWTPYEHFMKRLSGLINGHNILASRAAPKCIHSMLLNILMVRKYETRFKF